MIATLPRWAFLLAGLALAVGCRSPQPELMPARTAESLVAPPPEKRYETADSPREALEKTYNPNGPADAPKAIIPGSGIGSRSNNNRGPYGF